MGLVLLWDACTCLHGSWHLQRMRWGLVASRGRSSLHSLRKLSKEVIVTGVFLNGIIINIIVVIHSSVEENMQTIRRPFILLILQGIVGILFIVVLTGCLPTLFPVPASTPSPTSTPTPVGPLVLTTVPPPARCDPITASNDSGLAILTLPDGSQIYLSANTVIEFTPAGYCPGIQEHNILLKQGQVAVRSQLPGGKWVVVTSPDGYLALVGDTGLATYDPAGRTFSLVCTNGACALGTELSALTVLTCGEMAILDVTGNFSGPVSIDTTVLTQFGEWLQSVCVPFQTRTPEPPTGTPDAGATATGYCATFDSQFPLTPCPNTTP